MDLYSDVDLYQALVELQVIDAQSLANAKASSSAGNLRLAETLLKNDLISDENLGRIEADLIGVTLIRLTGLAIPEEVLRIVPEVVARKQQVIAFKQNDQGLSLALANPKNKQIQDFLAKKTGKIVHIFYATPRDIDEALGLYKKDLQKSFNELLAAQVQAANSSESDQAAEAPIIKIVNLLIEFAYANRASDIHVEPEKKRSLVRFRVDGVLRDVLELNPQLHEQIVSKIKVASRLRTDEHLSAQDGKLQAEVRSEELDIRVSIVPIVHGEKIVMRLLSSGARQLSIGDLGLNSADLAKVATSFSKPFGLILATGPTGSGKTTTVYTILKILNVREINIASIEDPVEYDIPGVNQIQVNAKTNLTFASGLRAILRQDPNAIFVGEIRDAETADIAVNSAMTGHLVLSTLHTNDAPTTLPRLLEMGVEPFLVAATVNVIIGQRLVRKICEKCRTSDSVLRTELAKHLPAETVRKYLGAQDVVRIYKGKGCPVCHGSGFLGRVGLFEVLVISETMKDLITSKSDALSIRRSAIAEGMTTMLEDGLDKVHRGITTVDEVIRATKE